MATRLFVSSVHARAMLNVTLWHANLIDWRPQVSSNEARPTDIYGSSSSISASAVMPISNGGNGSSIVMVTGKVFVPSDGKPR